MTVTIKCIKDIDCGSRCAGRLPILIELYLNTRFVNQASTRNEGLRHAQTVIRILAVAATLRKKVVDCPSPAAAYQREPATYTRNKFAVVALGAMVVVTDIECVLLIDQVPTREPTNVFVLVPGTFSLKGPARVVAITVLLPSVGVRSANTCIDIFLRINGPPKLKE